MILSKEFIKYAILPRFLPRIRNLFSGAFSYTAHLIAHLFVNMRLLPPDHPYTNAQNIGRFGIIKVMAQAGMNLKFNRNHIDQVILYFSVLSGMILLGAQILLFCFSLLNSPALATTKDLTSLPGFTNTWSDWFGPTIYGTKQDFAFIILEKIFGIQNASGTGGFWNTCLSSTTSCTDMQGNDIPGTDTVDYPEPIHKALHVLLQFYSTGLMVLAILITLYYIVTVAGETAVTGVPFGQRVNKSWVFVRFILAFALLTPLNLGAANSGLNGGQMLTFWITKWGSNMGSHAWVYFNDAITHDPNALIANSNLPDLSNLTRFAVLMNVCSMAQKMAYGRTIRAYVVRQDNSGTVNGSTGVASSIDYGDAAIQYGFVADAVDYMKYLNKFTNYGPVTVRFGELNVPDSAPASSIGIPNPPDEPDDYRAYMGYVKPYCGEVQFSTTATPDIGTALILSDYFLYVPSVIFQYDDDPHSLLKKAACIAQTYLGIAPDKDCDMLTKDDIAASTAQFDSDINGLTDIAYDASIAEDKWDITSPVLDKGWVAAGVWYNQIANKNGELASARSSLPSIKRYPLIMEDIARQHRDVDENAQPNDRFNPILSAGKTAKFEDDPDIDLQIASALYDTYMIWEGEGISSTTVTKPNGNSLLTALGLLLGTNGLLDMRKNDGKHPLAKLSALGKGMIEAVVRNMLFVAGSKIFEVISNDTSDKEMAGLANKFFMSMAMSVLALGFVLYYVLPFLPFIYVMFAASGWIKGIFEAIVAIPLWALGHLKLDGEGVAGRDAAGGYYLLLEIFLRPTLIIIGFMASIIISASAVDILNKIFDDAVSNVGGFDLSSLPSASTAGYMTSLSYWRGPIDQLFFTGIYTVLCYMICLSCFKLIDLIPEGILRWMGQSIQTIQETLGDPAGRLVGSTYRKTNLIGGQLARMSGPSVSDVTLLGP